MYDVNVKKYVEPLIDKNWNKKDRNIIDRLRITFKDSLYFKCFKKLFPHYAEYIVMCLLTSFKYKKYKPHEIILNYNDRVNKIYFIILGKVNIYKISLSKMRLLLASLCKKHKNVDKGKEILDYFNIYSKRYLSGVSEKNIFLKKNNTAMSNVNINKKITQIFELETFFKVIMNQNKILDYSLEEGKMFGEEYFYHEIKYSNCILECDSECIIGELDKEDYEKIYKRVNVIERSNIAGFIVNLKIFSSSKFFLPKLLRCLIKRNYSKNEIIFNQNDTFRGFYVVRKGKINLSLKIPKKVNCELEPEIIMGNRKNKRFTSNNAFVVKGEYLEYNEYNLVTIEEGGFIGEIEYYKNKDKYMYTAQCIEDCLLFEFDLFLFENLIKDNKSINNNLKNFFEKTTEKMHLLQNRIYTTKKSNSVIKKTDYVLSKNKFTQNLLENNPLKEDINNKKFINNSTDKKSNKNNKSNKSDYYYCYVLSPFLNRHLSAKGLKKLNKIQFNKAFFNSRNISKEFFSSKSTSHSRRRSKERICTTPNDNSKNLSGSKFTIYNKLTNNINERFNFLKSNNKNKNNKQNSNKIYKNIILSDYINYNTNKNFNNKNIIFNNFNKRSLSKKIKNLCLTNNINRTNSDKSFDFMDPNLDCTGIDKVKNIPIILKETKNSKRYKNLYDKDKIKKINSFYYESSLNKFNHIFNTNKVV